ncbi:MAG TPA: ribonuclease HII [Candidatus Paceibacterota bacterium]
MKLPHKTLEKKLFKSGYRYVFGVDEVGMGCLAGPVVVCAVRVTKDFYKKNHPKLRGLRESKLLSAIQREKFAKELMKEKNLVYAISSISPKVIDKINIYQAARLGMKDAIKKLKPNFDLKTIVLVDGKTKIKGVDYEQMPIVKGDRKIFAIACASVIAKVYRDKIITKYAKKYPNYGFEKHKGYGTKYHQAQLVAFGPCEIHRKSFRLT